jgi:hypothetical protein
MLSITINVTWRTIMGALFIGAAVAISSLTIVRAEHVTPDKKKTVYKCSTGTACLTGDSSGSKTWGIYAEGASKDALHAVTTTTVGNSAVAGISSGTSGSGNGVYGKSSNGEGVYGTSTTASGVYGTTSATGTPKSPLAGVYGNSSKSYGVYGSGALGVVGTSSTAGGAGVGGISTGDDASGVSAFGNSNNLSALVAETASDASPAPSIFIGIDGQNGDSCVIDPDANLTCSGKISGGGEMLTRHRSQAGRRVLTYAAQAATPTIEDLGAAQMHDGTANVEIPADFASVIDRSNPYYVFLTPMGDTRGLYVSMENAAGFQVRENMHGRSNVKFQYRIIGVPLDAKNVRLPAAPEIKVPRVPKLPPPIR